MDISEMKEVREVFGADAANELLQQGWVLLYVLSKNFAYGEGGFSYLLGSASADVAPRQ